MLADRKIRAIATGIILSSFAAGVVNAAQDSGVSTSPDIAYPGEFSFNNIEEVIPNSPSGTVSTVLLIESEADYNPGKKDSFNTSLKNKFDSFSAEPLKEGGLEQKSADII